MRTQNLGPQLTVDLSVEGFQVGDFSVHLGTGAAPLRTFNTPLCVFHQGDGPVVCLISGAQTGDVTGTTVLQNLVQEIELESIKGTVIVCPALVPCNTSCSVQCQSTNHWSEDDRELIQSTLYEQLLSACDVIIELKSSSANSVNSPHASVWPSEENDDKQSNELLDAIMFAAGAPESVRRFDSPLPNSLAELAGRTDTTFLQLELGRYARTDKASRLMGISQCRNALLHIGVLTQGHFELSSTRILEIGKLKGLVQAPTCGLVHWYVELGGAVHMGNPIAHITDPHRPFADPVIVNAQMNGVLLTKFDHALCTPDQLLALVGDEVPR